MEDLACTMAPRSGVCQPDHHSRSVAAKTVRRSFEQLERTERVKPSAFVGAQPAGCNAAGRA